MIGPIGPSGKCRTAQRLGGSVLEAAAADEAEQREDDQDDDDDPENAHSGVSFRRMPTEGVWEQNVRIARLDTAFAVTWVTVAATRRKEKPRRRRGFPMERVMGLEPTTFCMASRRSSQLSYTRPAAEV
jgi:hypothetical protein